MTMRHYGERQKGHSVSHHPTLCAWRDKEGEKSKAEKLTEEWNIFTLEDYM